MATVNHITDKYLSGQNIINFGARPSVNGTGVLLSGEALPAIYLKYDTVNIVQDSNALTQTIDIVSSGVQLTRGTYGVLYNILDQSEGSSNPTNTEWNEDGWGDLSDIATRTYKNFNQIGGGYNVGNAIIGNELVMRDTSTDKYYRVLFSAWQQGAGQQLNYRGFAYTRAEILLGDLETNYYRVNEFVNFTKLPTVNGTGVLLNGASLLTNIVYTTGDQTLNGIKTFTERPTVNGSGVRLQNESTIKTSVYDGNLWALNYFPTSKLGTWDGQDIDSWQFYDLTYSGNGALFPFSPYQLVNGVQEYRGYTCQQIDAYPKIPNGCNETVYYSLGKYHNIIIKRGIVFPVNGNYGTTGVDLETNTILYSDKPTGYRVYQTKFVNRTMTYDQSVDCRILKQQNTTGSSLWVISGQNFFWSSIGITSLTSGLNPWDVSWPSGLLIDYNTIPNQRTWSLRGTNQNEQDGGDYGNNTIFIDTAYTGNNPISGFANYFILSSGQFHGRPSTLLGSEGVSPNPSRSDHTHPITLKFPSRPNVNGTGFLLTGEALPSQVITVIPTPLSVIQENNSLTQTIDVVSSGVQLARGRCCVLYNPLHQSMPVNNPGWANPTNTEWNEDGWDDLPYVQYRTYKNLNLIGGGGNFASVVGKQLIMHDTSTDKYHKVLFSAWQQGAGGDPNYRGFAYTRIDVEKVNTNYYQVSGLVNFTSRPTINGTGVLLSGEAASLPDTILYTTGNQIKSGSLIIGSSESGVVNPNSPYTLSVQSNISNTWLEILNHSGANQGVFFGIDGNNLEQWNFQGGDILFLTSENPSAGTERLRITKSGNVGIGTSYPSEKLEIVGNLKVSNSGFFANGIKVGNNSITITENRIEGGYSSGSNSTDGLLGVQYSGYFDNDPTWFNTASVRPIITQLELTGASPGVLDGTYTQAAEGLSYFTGNNGFNIYAYRATPPYESYWFVSDTNNFNTSYYISYDLETWETGVYGEIAPTATILQTKNYENGIDFGINRGLINGTSSEWVGYFKAPETTNYNFTLNADEVAYFWTGDKALNGYTTGNADISVSAGGGSSEISTLNSGEYYPVRLQWGHPLAPTSANLSLSVAYNATNFYNFSGLFFHGSVGQGFYIDAVSGSASFGGNIQANSATFNMRPTVNGTGVLLSGEAASLPDTIVYTTGDQTISGEKTFSASLFVFSGANVVFVDNTGVVSGEWQFNNHTAFLSGINIGGNEQTISPVIKMYDNPNGDYNKITWEDNILTFRNYPGGSGTPGGDAQLTLNFQSIESNGIRTIAVDERVVHNFGDETISGIKNFKTGQIYLGNSVISARSGLSENLGIGGAAGNIYLDGGDSRSSNSAVLGGSGGYIDLRGGGSTNGELPEDQYGNGGAGGWIQLKGGPITQDANAGGGGYIQANGAYRSAGGFIELNAGGEYSNGGYIKLNGGIQAASAGYIEANGFWGDYGNVIHPGGYINLNSAIEGAGGHIDLSSGGGSIETRGKGKIEFGSNGTRTTLSGTATQDTTIYLPDQDGTLLTTNSNVVYTTGDQTISGVKTFNDNVYIKNLFVTGTETIVSTTSFNVQSPYLILNLTGGAVDGGIFFVTGAGLTGINDTGPIIGFDHSNKFKFGISTRNSDLSTLPDIASVQQINNLSGYVTGITGTFGASVNALNIYAVLTTGNQTISGIKTFTTGVDIVNGTSAQSLRVFNTTGNNSGEFGVFGWQLITSGAPNSLVIGAQSTQSGILRDVLITGANVNINSSGQLNIFDPTNIVGNLTVSGNTTITGHLSAATKSFLIQHPVDSGKKLQYGSLESPYHGIRLTDRAKIMGNSVVVELPKYISALISQEKINVQLTNINHSKVLFVKEVNAAQNYFVVGADCGWFDYKEYEFYWSFTAERKDVPPLEVEF